MRYQIPAAIIRGARLLARSIGARGLWVACCVVAPNFAWAQQRADPNIPGRTILAALGVRDAGNLATVWETAVGVRFPLTRRVNGGLTVSRAEVPLMLCPLEPGFPRCPTGGWLSAVDLELEFFYGNGVVHPYGVVALGAGHLSLPDEDVRRTAFAYSTGLGLGGRVASRVWLFLEGRWRQETFNVYSAHGLIGRAGAKFGF